MSKSKNTTILKINGLIRCRLFWLPFLFFAFMTPSFAAETAGVISDCGSLTEKLTKVHWFLLLFNGLLLLFSRPIFNKLTHFNTTGEKKARTLRLFQAINLFIILLVLFYNLYQPLASENIFSRLVGSLMVVYMVYLVQLVARYVIRYRYGKKIERGGEVIVEQTYNSRLLSLLIGIFLSIVALISVVHVWGFDGLLEAGGVVGFIGVLLALTQAAWAPDIISGLIILNSRTLVEGNTISFDDHGHKIIGVVFKTKVFHTEIINFANNHRITIKNALLREKTIHNLSKLSSQKGLRECLRFKIGYDVPAAKVEAMFVEVETRARADNDLAVSDQHDMQVVVLNAGDYAVEWGLQYHTKEIKQLLITRYAISRLVLDVSIEHGISLATPTLIETQKQEIEQAIN